jgi:MoaA/NifB/PqqE/SkfB family radical SAM enzyme
MSVRQYREMQKPYSTPYDLNFEKQLEPFIPHLREASFTGGEAFLIKIYYTIWEKMLALNPEIILSVTTNGTTLNERINSILEKLRFNITISLDSVHKENYEKIRKNARFEEVFAHLEYYIEYTHRKNTTLNVKICPLRQNWHEIPDIFRFLNEKNITANFNTVIFPPYCTLWNLNPEQLNEIIHFLSGFTFSVITDTQKKNSERYQNLVRQLKNWQKEAVERENKYSYIYRYDTEALLKLLLKQVNDFLVSSDSYETDNKDTFSVFFSETMNRCREEIKDTEVLKNALIYYITVPVHWLVSEFNIRDAERIINRTIQAGRKE